MLQEDKKSGYASYHDPLHHELPDCFTSTNTPAPGATYSSATGKFNMNDSNTNNDRSTSTHPSGQDGNDDTG